MSGKKQYDLASFRQAIEAHRPDVTAIARAVGCTRSTVYAYLRRYPELQGAYDGGGKSSEMVAAEDDSRTKHSKEAVLKAVQESQGIKAQVAAKLGCSRSTVDNYLERWADVREAFDASRSTLVSVAASALALDVANPDSKGHQPAYMFVLKTLGKDEGFTERTEVTGANGADLFGLSPEILRLSEMIGFDWAGVGMQLAKMIKMQAVEKGLLQDGTD